MGHHPKQTLKLKLKRDTKETNWDTNQIYTEVETKMGHQPNIWKFKTKMGHKTDRMDTNQVETIMGHQPNDTLKLKLKWDTTQIRQ